MAEQRVEAPRANVAIDVKALPIGPEEAFVMSRVDGHATAAEIALTTGLPLDRVQLILRQLQGLGAVQGHAPSATAASDSTPSAPCARACDVDNRSEPVPPPALMVAAGFTFVPDVDLKLEEQQAIWDAWSSLQHLNHYELLGVPRDASRSAIRDAYFERVASVHPDKHFGRRLGSFKQKLEVVFQALTVAHETLVRARKREAYDATLVAESRSSAASSPTSQAPARRSPTSQAPAQRPSVPQQQRAVSVPPRLTGSAAPPAIDNEERRLMAQRALERTLRGVRRSPLASTGSPTFPPPTISSAPPAINKATACAPDADIERAQQAAARGDRSSAARLFSTAAERTGDCELYARAAECYRAEAAHLQDAALLRKAADNARKAVAKAPSNSRLRMALSGIYAEAGMMTSSLREAERALQLAPESHIIQSWVEQLKRQGA